MDARPAITRRAFARVGLLGNPSDGFFGKTLSFALANFHADVTLAPSERLCFLPHPVHDPLAFDSLEALVARTQGEGYYGGIRLLMAMCCKLHAFCAARDIVLDTSSNFTMSYDTNIPRQTGLAGSSAILTAALHCLLEFYNIKTSIPLDDQPSLVLSAETELGITGGLQDRVIQTYGGLVHMDFQKEHLERTGKGIYTPMNPALLPSLQLVYAKNPSDSGKAHSTVKERWLQGDASVAAAMSELGALVDAGCVALEQQDWTLLAKLMDRNFDVRRAIYGDAAIGALNIKMITTARSVGAAAKFTGSGGACVVFCPDGQAQVQQLVTACEVAGLSVVEAKYAPPLQSQVYT
eukprot:SM000071S21105  [mRNA]  locus=s71:431511:433500:+ [translate_table: standard]